MSMPLGAAKYSKLIAISTVPSINFTSHKKTNKAGYTLVRMLDNAVDTIDNVTFNGEPGYVLAKTTQPNCFGDEMGIGGGVKSGTVGKEVKPTSGSSGVLLAGLSWVRERDTCTMNNENTVGKYISFENMSGSEMFDYMSTLPLSAGSAARGLGGQAKHTRRDMQSGEQIFTKSVFGDAINFGEKGKGKGVGIYDGKWRFFQPDNRAMAPNGNIYFPGNSYKEDFSDIIGATDLDRYTYIHEMTHVWQHQNGKAVKSRGFGLGVLDTIGFEVYPYELDTSKDLSRYGLEQQASIVADYYAIRDNLNVTNYATNGTKPNLQDYIDVIGDNFKKPSPKVW